MCRDGELCLFANAQVLGKNAACLLTISDSFVSPEITTAEQRQTSFTNMMKVALARSTKFIFESERGLLPKSNGPLFRCQYSARSNLI